MSSIERRVRRGEKRWYARYRDPSGKQRVKVFARKLDAERYLTTIEASKLTGAYVDPSLGHLTVDIWSQRWLAGQIQLKASTRARYEGIVRAHVGPRWGRTRLADIQHSDVQAWVTDLSSARSPATVRKVHRVLSLILALAVADGRLVRNPATGISLPRVANAEKRFLTHQQVDDLARYAGDPYDRSSRASKREKSAAASYRLIVLFLAYTGVRFGEMAALRVGRLDLQRRRASIVEAVTLVGGVQTWGTPKGHERRDVPIPRFLAGELAVQVARRSLDELVFPAPEGGALRAQGFQRATLNQAANRAGQTGLHPHELRHTAASLAIASGADVKVVQQMLGHRSATMTLDLYGHLFADRLDEVAERLNADRTAALVYPVCTRAELQPLSNGSNRG